MNSIKLFLALFACVSMSEATFVLGTGALTITGGGALLATLLGLKAAAIGGYALGRALGGRRRSYGSRRSFHRRYGRSVETEEDMMAEVLLDASLNDADDCGKKLICILNAQESLAEDEAKIAQLFGKTESIDLSAVTVEFDVAALMGKKVGEAQCETIYSRCNYGVKDLMNVIRQPLYNQL